ncbi:cysteine hydrolase family protein [Diplocloster agilis]|uniref:Cysteine hydrolase n=1 Tax=Diplocloster agilis TaxID=2850323 RepID=A0A949K224_9FIRM|nr:isochorismatase family cysteine hydrolase [Diplocloster agilis]MBU9739490.1 cysteine hydrolase [Diplocloster agilis]
MKKLLAVIDMQKDFIDGALGTPEAQAIVPGVLEKIRQYHKAGDDIVFTMDTHTPDYRNTQEGRKLPVPHCIKGSVGFELSEELLPYASVVFEKPTFGSVTLAEYAAGGEYEQIELIGLCTDICVISNALLLKAYLPESRITVDSKCCAGVTPESHQNALEAMKMCQIEIR